MKYFITFIAIIVTSQAAVIGNSQWAKFKNIYQKQYSDVNEEQYRFKIFQEKSKLIEEHNEKFEKGLVSYKMAVNQFTDITQEEFLEKLKISAANKPQIKYDSMYSRPLNIQDPATVDWRLNGSVTPVKDQGMCGSCWSFSATGSMEGQNQIINKKLVSLSEQQLVDCAGGSYGNMGCMGGLMDSAFDYVRDNGITTEDNYPYEGVDGNCRYQQSERVLSVSGHIGIIEDDEGDLKSAVTTIGPISVAIDATYLSSYGSGIYTDSYCSKYGLNHGVLAVGYGSENGQDYWIVKNSWGAAWGENGYVRMARNINLCGIASMASYPTL